MSIFLGAFIMIFLAEMGDKSQLMAFCLVSRYKISTILIGIFVATLIANGIAVFIGSILGEIINMEILTIVSALAFLGFGGWILLEKNDEYDEVSANNSKLGSLFSVISLFTIAEMGDKTQLATAVYAATFGAPILTLGGVLAGMLLADALGIYLGLRLKNLVSRAKLKIFSSLVFFILGGISFMSCALIPSQFIWLLLAFYLMMFRFFLSRRRRAN